ncbi:MAG: hypothetical protein ABIG96_03530 [Candidatus Micrarchaeota archaeon]
MNERIPLSKRRAGEPKIAAEALRRIVTGLYWGEVPKEYLREVGHEPYQIRHSEEERAPNRMTRSFLEHFGQPVKPKIERADKANSSKLKILRTSEFVFDTQLGHGIPIFPIVNFYAKKIAERYKLQVQVTGSHQTDHIGVEFLKKE